MKAIPFLFILGFLFSCSKNQEESLFNGKNLSGWYTYLGIPDSAVISDLPRDSSGKYFKAAGINIDPFGVFSVTDIDGQPAIRISGEVYGTLITEKEFSNYHLHLEFKWGEKKYPAGSTRKRDSGIMYHCQGKEGGLGGVWMRCKEFQVKEGDLGDFIVVDTGAAVVPCLYDSSMNLYYYNENGTPLEFTEKFGYCHKSADYELKQGMWNTLDLYTFNDQSIQIVNGNVVLRAYHLNIGQSGKLVPHTGGKIVLQSEGAEIFYKNIIIRSITEFPKGIEKKLKGDES
jgi:hypothetical protein